MNGNRVVLPSQKGLEFQPCSSASEKIDHYYLHIYVAPDSIKLLEQSVDNFRINFHVEYEKDRTGWGTTSVFAQKPEKPIEVKPDRVHPLTSLKPDFLSDVVISCEGKDFSAHRAVLASKSIKLSYKFSKSLNL
jgi:hypothetical protein